MKLVLFTKLWFVAKEGAVAKAPELLKSGLSALVRTVAGRQASATAQQTTAVREVLEALRDIPNAVIRVGNVYLIKLTGAGGEPVVVAQPLSDRQRKQLEADSEAIAEPLVFLRKLAEFDDLGEEGLSAITQAIRLAEAGGKPVTGGEESSAEA